MQRIELLVWSGCPSHEVAAVLANTLSRDLELAPPLIRWVEDHQDAVELGFVGSPTFRLDGVELIPPEAIDGLGLNCRVYRREKRFSPLPDPADLIDAARSLLRRPAAE